MHEITPCLWFDTQDEEAARFYTSVFPTHRSWRSPATAQPGPAPKGR
jgi:predicted 3-demethylubiquinone-9 3-methyltransferase (glyoxalase superfamily)